MDQQQAEIEHLQQQIMEFESQRDEIITAHTTELDLKRAELLECQKSTQLAERESLKIRHELEEINRENEASKELLKQSEEENRKAREAVDTARRQGVRQVLDHALIKRAAEQHLAEEPILSKKTNRKTQNELIERIFKRLDRIEQRQAELELKM